MQEDILKNNPQKEKDSKKRSTYLQQDILTLVSPLPGIQKTSTSTDINADNYKNQPKCKLLLSKIWHTL